MNNVLLPPSFSGEVLRPADAQEVAPEPDVATGEVESAPSEPVEILGRLALAASMLESSDDISALPEIRAGMMEGWHENIASIAESPEKTSEFINTNIEIFDKLNELGDAGKASKMLTSLAFQLAEGGSFSSAIEEGVVDDEQLYKIFSSISQVDRNEQGFLFKQLAGRSANKFVVSSTEDDVRLIRASEAFELSLKDDTDKGESTRAMFGKNLASSLFEKEKQDETIENPKMIQRLLMSYGLNNEQSQEVFEALAQSKSETYSPLLDQRTQSTLELFLELRGGESGTEHQQEHIQALYQKYGIRNFFRYSKADLLPQLTEGFSPEEVVITAVSDEGGALANPRNSIQGLKYQKPAYFEASGPLDIAKSLLRSSKMRHGEPIEKVLIRAHGSPEGFLLSRTQKHGTVETADIQARAEGWESLITEKGIVDKNAEVVFESCSLGAGEFPQSLYTSTQLENILTSPKNIVGSALEGSPGVIRQQDGSVRFGVGAPNMQTKERLESELAEPVGISKQ